MLRQMGVETVGTTTSVVPTGAIAARLAGLRHVWHVREYYPTETLIPTLGIAPTMRLIRLLSNRVIVPSRKLAALFPDGAHDVEVLPEAIDAKYFDVPKVARTDARKALAIPSGRSLVAVVGTLEASKDQLTALRVLTRLREQDMDVGLILCGGCYDLSYEKRLREEAQALCVADRVHFVGFQREVLLVYDASDVLLVTSTRESFGLTIIEAMARNVPVVATRCGGPEETIDDKDTGYLVGIADVNAMAQRIGTLLSDTALASSMTKKAKAFSLRFHPDENLEKTMRSYGFARTVQQ
jgi:glycosyltransferase involved in cell wall biosynthesis